MRALADAARIRSFMRALGERSLEDVRVYLTGGACAVLLGIRGSTIDVDIRVEPETDALFRAIPQLKDALQINVELAAPSDFIPELQGWRERSPFVVREGRVSFHHYDFYAQALAKLERGHAQDREDVQAMIARGLVEPAGLLTRFTEIEPRLYRYPAVDPAAFRKAVEAVAGVRRG